MATPVAYGWAGAVQLENPHFEKKVTDGPTNAPTKTAR